MGQTRVASVCTVPVLPDNAVGEPGTQGGRGTTPVRPAPSLLNKAVYYRRLNNKALSNRAFKTHPSSEENVT